MDDLDADLFVGELLERSLDGLGRALNVGFDDQVQFLHLTLLELGEQALERDLLVELVEIVLDLLLSLLDELTGHALVGDGAELVSRRRDLGQAGDLNGDGRACVLDLLALVVRHDAHAADGRARDDDIALMERAVLDEQRGDRAAGLVEAGLDDAALTGAVGVGLQLLHLGGQDDRLQQVVDAHAGLGRDLADLGLAAPFCGR